MASAFSKERLEILSSIDQLWSIDEQLANLATDCRASAFMHPAFFLPYAEEACRNGQNPFCLVMMRGGDLVAFLPLFTRRDRKALFARRLSPPRFGTPPSFEFLIRSGEDEAAILDAFAEAIKAETWADLTFPEELADSRLATAFAERFNAPGFRVSCRKSHSYYVLRGFDDAEAYVASMQSQTRKVLRRWERRFEEVGEVTCHTSADDIPSVENGLREAIEGSRKSGRQTQKRLLPFFRSLMDRMMPLGLMRVWLARHDGRCVAALIEFADANNHRHFYFSALDEAAKKMNVGMTLLFMASKAAMDDGVDECEYWGHLDYLRKVSNDTRQTVNLSIRRDALVPRLQLRALDMFTRSRNALRTAKAGRTQKVVRRGGTPAGPEIRVEIFRDLDDLIREKDALTALARASHARAYSYPSFLIPWAKAAMTDRQVPACLAMRRGEDLIGFFPFFSRSDPKLLLAERRMPPRFGSSPQFEFLIHPDVDRNDVLDRFAEVMREEPWHDQEFRREPTDSLVSTDWAARFDTPDFTVTRTKEYPNFIISGCDSSQSYLDQMTSKTRRELRRQERRFEESGEVKLFTSPEAVVAHLEDMESVIRGSWKMSDKMETIGLRMLRDIAEAAAQDGNMRLWLAYVGLKPVSMLFELADTSGNRHAYFNATDQTDKKLDIGVTLLFKACRVALDEGVKQYDFWGYRKYLKQLANQTRALHSLRIERTGTLPAVRKVAEMGAETARALIKPEQ